MFFGFDNSPDSFDRHCHLIVLGFELGSIPVPAGSILPQQESAALGSLWSPADSDIRDAAFDLDVEPRRFATLLVLVIDLSLPSLDLAIFVPVTLCEYARHDRSGVLLV